MTAYWISQYREISDETRMAAYAAILEIGRAHV